MNRRRFLASSAAFTTLAALPSCSKAPANTLTLFTWEAYLSQEAKERFEKEFDCKIVIETFDSNESMLAKLEAGATGYDVLVPSSYAVQILVRKGLVQKLDPAKIPNLGNIDKAYLTRSLDPKMEYCVPYLMAPTCLAYLAPKVTDPVNSWSMLEKTELKGRVTLLDDMREVLGGALKSLGHSLNSTSAEELAKAADVAIRWKANIAKFENEQYKGGIASGEYFLVHGYAGDLIEAAEENKDVKIFIPQEGASFPCDDLCIPKDAKNADLAHKFINFMSDAEVSAKNMDNLGYRSPNSAAYSRLSEDFRGSEILFPPDELFAKCESIDDIGDALPLWTKEWDRVKNA